jgi:hypothetical protein
MGLSLTPSQMKMVRGARGKPGKARKKRFTGDSSAFKAWVRLMDAGPGIFIAMKTVNELNKHEHWRYRQQRAKSQHSQVLVGLASAKGLPESAPVRVLLTRYSPGQLDSHDGLRASLKFVVDEIASWYGVDDADPQFEWVYRQDRARHYGVRILIESSMVQEPTAIKPKGATNGY